jgi:hypothetical protein
MGTRRLGAGKKVRVTANREPCADATCDGGARPGGLAEGTAQLRRALRRGARVADPGNPLVVAQLGLVAAVIQRITLENRRLRQEAEAAANVIRLGDVQRRAAKPASLNTAQAPVAAAASSACPVAMLAMAALRWTSSARSSGATSVSSTAAACSSGPGR